jgi:S1-C subfamily serine protease
MRSTNTSNGYIRRRRAAASFAGVLASVTLATAACGASSQTAPAAAPGAAKSQQPAASQSPRTMSTKDLYEQGRHSVFQIVGRVPGGAASGTGFVVDRATGMALTNAHVVSDMTAIKAYFPDGNQYSLHVMAQDPCSDLAIVHFADALDTSITQVSLGSAAQLQVGDPVTTLGFPPVAAASAEESPRPTVATGMVQANKAVVTGGDDLPQYVNSIQHNATINPGNSGGPLYDARGKVVGINSLSTASPEVQGLFYSISMDRVKDKLAALEGGNSENDAGWTLKPLSSFTFSELLPELGMGSRADGAAVDGAVRTGELKGS